MIRISAHHVTSVLDSGRRLDWAKMGKDWEEEGITRGVHVSAARERPVGRAGVLQHKGSN